MHRIVWIAGLLLACADEEKLAALEKRVADLESELEDARDDIKRLQKPEKDDIDHKLDDLQRKLDRIDQQARLSPPPLTPQRLRRPEPDAAKVYSVPVDGYPSLGPADAKVTIVEGYDYACPFCEKSRATIKELRDKYRGDLRVVYKPLVVHPTNAMAGALAACAAHRQGKFEQMDAAIWERGFKARDLDASDTGRGTKCWDEPDGCPKVVSYARDLQLNLTKFKSDMRDCHSSVVNAQRDFNALSVMAIPGFFVNGRFLSGAQPVSAFTPLVEEELRKANDRIASGTSRSRYYEEAVVRDGQKTLDP